MEKSATGVEGFLMYDPVAGEFFFRVYNSSVGSYTDYKIAHRDLQVKIVDDYASFYEGDEVKEPLLDYDSQTLGAGY